MTNYVFLASYRSLPRQSPHIPGKPLAFVTWMHLILVIPRSLKEADNPSNNIMCHHIKTPGVWNSWKWHTTFSYKLLQYMTPLHLCHEFPRFQNMSTSCLTATVSLRNWYTNWTDKWHFKTQMLLCTKHHLHSLIHTISALTNTPKLHNYFFVGTLYRCNRGCILTVVRAHDHVPVAEVASVRAIIRPLWFHCLRKVK